MQSSLRVDSLPPSPRILRTGYWLDSTIITPPYDDVSASVNAFSFDGPTIYAGSGIFHLTKNESNRIVADSARMGEQIASLRACPGRADPD